MKRKFKDYVKEYEEVYSSKRSLQSAPLDKISNTMGLTNFQYAEYFKKYGREMLIGIFDYMVKFVWLNMRFTYSNMGLPYEGSVGTGYLRGKFATFARNYIGIDFKSVTSAFFPIKVSSYFKDFFPLFNKEDPFKNPEYYKFPYNNITPDFLMLVYQMPERLDILKIAETRGMTFATFYDYVINYVMCCNEEKGREVFTFKHMKHHCPSYVKYNSKVYKRVISGTPRKKLSKRDLKKIAYNLGKD